MSLLGIDVGTTGCKAGVFSEKGRTLSTGYEEYDMARPRPGWNELDAVAVWEKVKRSIRRTVQSVRSDPVKALAVSSLGEAVVPVSAARKVLGPSILNSDARGTEYLARLRGAVEAERLYRINGNILGNHYTLPKLLWIKEHMPELHERADIFLHWASFVSFMLGADPRVDFSLANRTLLFDIERECWSQELGNAAGIDLKKFPQTIPSGAVIGSVSSTLASELGLPRGIPIVAGAHDQCSNAVGCGVISEGQAMCGMGTYFCVAPVFRRRPDPTVMREKGLNTEHHAVRGSFVSFLYNPGGAIVKWFRDAFARRETEDARKSGRDVYEQLTSEMPRGRSGVMVLPHFAPTGPPDFVTRSSGVMMGLKLETGRGEILKGILEGIVFYIRELVDSLSKTGVLIKELRAVGGGSRSDAWVQLCADILETPFTRPKTTEAGCLGAAIIAGVGTGAFSSFEEGVAAMVSPGDRFEPDPGSTEMYSAKFERYTKVWPLLKEFLTSM